jgi:phage FluMu protein Com
MEEYNELKCKVCWKLLLKASPDTKGTVKAYCKRCKKERTFALPFQGKAENIITESSKLNPERSAIVYA